MKVYIYSERTLIHEKLSLWDECQNVLMGEKWSLLMRDLIELKFFKFIIDFEIHH